MHLLRHFRESGNLGRKRLRLEALDLRFRGGDDDYVHLRVSVFDPYSGGTR